MDREARDKELYDANSYKCAMLDITPSSIIARKAQLFLAIKPLLDKSQSLGVIVDVGCGVGSPAKYLNGLYTKYIGIDHSKEMIKSARVYNSGNTKCEFYDKNIKELNREIAKADVILVMGALHHIEDLDDALDRIVRLGKNGATLVAVEPQRLNPIIQFLRLIRKAIDPRYSKEQVYFSENELIGLFERHGIDEIKTYYQGFFTTPFATVVLKPQFLFIPLSWMATKIDLLLNLILCKLLKKLSFKIVIMGKINLPINFD